MKAMGLPIRLGLLVLPLLEFFCLSTYSHGEATPPALASSPAICPQSAACADLGARGGQDSVPFQGLALRPPMGWNSWNHFGCKVDEGTVRRAADALVKNGMKDLGYSYVVIDDCWPARARDAGGNLQADPVRFPHGIAALARYVHARGLKFGIYEDAGATTCAGYPGSFGHENEDAVRFAAWGVDYLKYDFCHRPLLNWSPNIDRITVSNGASFSETVEAESPDASLDGVARIEPCSGCSGGTMVGHIGNGQGTITLHLHGIPKPGTYRLSISFTNGDLLRLAWVSVDSAPGLRMSFPSTGGWGIVSTASLSIRLQSRDNTVQLSNPLTRVENAEMLYERMRAALQRTGRQIVFSICDPYRRTEPWRWGSRVGNLWRTTPDIHDTWQSVLAILDQQIGLEDRAGPGHWNDPDMLEVGNGGMNAVEERTHFSLWSMLAAPLFAGNDIAHMTPTALPILTNRDVIAVDQDSRGMESTRIQRRAGQEIWARLLSGGDRAVLFLNRGEEPATFRVTMSNLGLDAAHAYLFRDVWAHMTLTRRGSIAITVPPHGSAMFRVRDEGASREP